MTAPHPLSITGTTQIFGCIAYPSDHVRAPMIFNQIFAESGADKVMIPLSIPPSELAQSINGLRGLANFKGAAVTIPHKMPLASLCDELGQGGIAAQAVNAIRFDEQGRLYGNNFDGEGFVAGLKGQNPAGLCEDQIISGKKILIVGAGGAARAILLALANEAIEKIDIVNRTSAHAQKAVSLTKELVRHAPVTALQQQDVDFAEYNIIINATPLGLHDDDPMPFNIDLLADDCLVCDIIMIPERTKLLAAAERSGRPVLYGRHMLDYQIELIGQFIGAI